MSETQPVWDWSKIVSVGNILSSDPGAILMIAGYPLSNIRDQQVSVLTDKAERPYFYVEPESLRFHAENQSCTLRGHILVAVEDGSASSKDCLLPQTCQWLFHRESPFVAVTAAVSQAETHMNLYVIEAMQGFKEYKPNIFSSLDLRYREGTHTLLRMEDWADREGCVLAGMHLSRMLVEAAELKVLLRLLGDSDLSYISPKSPKRNLLLPELPELRLSPRGRDPALKEDFRKPNVTLTVCLPANCVSKLPTTDIVELLKLRNTADNRLKSLELHIFKAKWRALEARQPDGKNGLKAAFAWEIVRSRGPFLISRADLGNGYSLVCRERVL